MTLSGTTRISEAHARPRRRHRVLRAMIAIGGVLLGVLGVALGIVGLIDNPP